MNLTDMLDLNTWKALEDELHARSGLEANVFDTDGVRITEDEIETMAAGIAHLGTAQMEPLAAFVTEWLAQKLATAR